MTVITGDGRPETDERSALFVYGVVRAGTDLPAMSGMAGHPIEGVVHEQVMAVVGEVDVGGPAVRKADLLAYQQVLDRLAEQAPVVPVRFGTALPAEGGAVETFLADRTDDLLALLDALEGRSQFTLRVRYAEDAVLGEVLAADPALRELNDRTRGAPADSSWADRVRLGELLAQAVEQRRQGDADDLLETVLPLAVEHRVLRGSGLDHVLEVALLVDDERAPGLEETLEAYAEAAHERIRLRLLGPLAPYDFVGST